MSPSTEDSSRIEEAHQWCEQRLEPLKTPFLDAARQFEDPGRRRAFFAAYYFLRIEGPFSLPRPAGRAFSLEDSHKAIRGWRDTVRLCFQGQPNPARPEQVALADTMSRFGIPMGPWLEYEKGLHDLADRLPVPDMQHLLVRARRLGAAQSSVFLRIIAARAGVRRYHFPPQLNADELAHDPGAFAYLVRQMVGVFAELELWDTPFTNLPADLMERHDLTAVDLVGMRGLTRAPRAFYELMHDLAHLAWRFYENGVSKLTQAASYLTRDAVARVDGVISGYKDCLVRIENAGFAPATLETISAERKGRVDSPGGAR